MTKSRNSFAPVRIAVMAKLQKNKQNRAPDKKILVIFEILYYNVTVFSAPIFGAGRKSRKELVHYGDSY